MSHVAAPNGDTQFLAIFRDHVTDPLATAIRRVDRERREVTTERDAFATFASRVESIPTQSVRVSPSPGPMTIADSPSGSDDALRKAYAETVMAVPHFDPVYGEAMGENLVAEFGGEFAQLFHDSGGVPFSATHKQALLQATQSRVKDRERFGEALDAERESLASSREKIEEMLATLDSTSIPVWYADGFRGVIEDVIAGRQRTIHTRPSQPHSDGHELCEYLYTTPAWTYPVLTAAGRLLDVITIEA